MSVNFASESLDVRRQANRAMRRGLQGYFLGGSCQAPALPPITSLATHAGAAVHANTRLLGPVDVDRGLGGL